MPIALAAFLTLAQACAPSVAPVTLGSVVRIESGFDPLVIGINSPRRERVTPKSTAEAVSTAERLIAAGDSIDLGLGQINSRNLAWLGLSVAESFDPCRNLAAAARVLKADFDRAGRTPGDEQTALRTALSYYNTGDAGRGFRNGYVAKVTAAANQIVPALSTVADAAVPAAPSPEPPPAAWDVFARPSTPTAGFVFAARTEDDAR